MTMARGGATGTVERYTGGGASGLGEVVELILDKGLVIDVFARVSLVGIEILSVDVRIVVASVDTYLRFAEATNRLDLYGKGGKGLPQLIESVNEGGARGRTSGMLDAATEKIGELFSGGSGDSREREEALEERAVRRRRPER